MLIPMVTWAFVIGINKAVEFRPLKLLLLLLNLTLLLLMIMMTWRNFLALGASMSIYRGLVRGRLWR